MTKKIMSLTSEQQAKISEYRDRWIEIGLKTGPGNRQAAERALHDAYREGGLEPPRFIFWAQSPISGLLTVKFLKEFLARYPKNGEMGDQVGAQVGAQVWAQVRAQVGDQVWDQVWAQVLAQVGDQVWDQVGAQVLAQVGDQVGAQVGAQVWDQVGDQVWDQVGAQVGDQVWDQVWAQVWAQVRAQVGDQVWDQVLAQVGAQVRAQVGDQVRGSDLSAEWGELWFSGNHDAGFLSFYSYFLEVCGLDVCKRLDPLSRLAREAGWVWMYRGAAVITECPSEIHMTVNARGDRKILHCETGPAIRYADGYELYALNGVRVTKTIIDTAPDDFTKEMVLGEANVDIRRELFRKIGIVNFINKIGGKTIHAWRDYELIEVDFQDGKRRRGLKMKNPSIDAVHFERVDDKCSTVQEALAWRNQMPSFVEPEVLT